MKSKEEVLNAFYIHRTNDCESCPYHVKPKDECVKDLILDMLVLVNRKEIDPLKLFKGEGESDAEQER